jgi:hypothetical protein
MKKKKVKIGWLAKTCLGEFVGKLHKTKSDVDAWQEFVARSLNVEALPAVKVRVTVEEI